MTKDLHLIFIFSVLSLCLLITPSAADSARQGPVPVSPESICPLLIGQKIPGATLKTSEGESFDLAASVAHKPTILIFYRGGW